MKADAPDLKRTQEIFWSLITAPEGVRPAVDEMRRRGVIAEASLGDLFVNDEQLAAVDRVDIYANMYFYRLLDSLREDYPRIEAAIGGERFHNLVTDYLLRHPSHHPSLRYLGQSMPDFLATHPVGKEYLYLADLARLEWTRLDTFDAPDVPPLTREGLARIPQDRAGNARLRLVPAFSLHRFDYDVVRLWRELKEPGDADQSAPGTEGNAALEGKSHFLPATGPRQVRRKRIAARIWRSDFIVYHKGIGEEEARCLELAMAGESLGRICQQLSAGRSAARATERVGKVLQSWIDDGIIAEATLSDA